MLTLISASELDYLENILFLQTNLDPYLHSCIIKIYNKYKFIYDLAQEIHETRFIIRYCKLLLENQKNEKIDSELIIAVTEETRHDYYLYRKRTLNIIYETLKNELAVTE